MTRYIPLISPRTSERNPRMPKLTRKYQDTEDTYDTSSVLSSNKTTAIAMQLVVRRMQSNTQLDYHMRLLT